MYQTFWRLLAIAEPDSAAHRIKSAAGSSCEDFEKSGKSGKAQPHYLIRNAPGSPLLPGTADMERTRQLNGWA
jgi:hypothetical protein